MLFFYIRHGDPIYHPDSLTPLGQRQAEAIGRRLARHGLDRIYASTSNRAILTATPASEILRKDIVQLDFANEHHAWMELTIVENEKRYWMFQHTPSKELFAQPEMRALGNHWYEHPALEKWNFKKGIDRIRTESDAFFASLGYEHIPDSGRYKVVTPNNERVALFAHQGFGIAFLSCLLDIPYPQYASHFDICHTGMTVIDFKEENGYAYPTVLMHSSDAHLYQSELPTTYNYNHRI